MSLIVFCNKFLHWAMITLIQRMRMGERVKDNFNRYSISGPTFIASGILFREQVFAQFLSSFSVQAKKKSCVYCNMPKKIGSVGRDFFFFFFFL